LFLFFTTGSTEDINPNHAARLEERLQTMHTATCIEDMELPGFQLHPLEGGRKKQWTVSVSGNWRVVFEFKNGHAYVVNYEDYR
jgi:toxin HigB-1